MARKNRKKKRVDGFVFPVPFAGAVVLASALALGYVWLSCRCEAVGEELKALEVEKKELSKKYLTEEYRWMRMKSPRNVERALERHNIVMGWPRRDQVIRMGGAHLSMTRDEAPTKIDEDYPKLAKVILNE